MSVAGLLDERAAESVHVATADHRQADYFMRMLTDSCRLIEHRIDRHKRELASAEAAGNLRRPVSAGARCATTNWSAEPSGG
jgi:hypothetical protein